MDKLSKFLDEKRHSASENQNNGLVLLFRGEEELSVLLSAWQETGHNDLLLDTVKGFGCLDNYMEKVRFLILYTPDNELNCVSIWWRLGMILVSEFIWSINFLSSCKNWKCFNYFNANSEWNHNLQYKIFHFFSTNLPIWSSSHPNWMLVAMRPFSQLMWNVASRFPSWSLSQKDKLCIKPTKYSLSRHQIIKISFSHFVSRHSAARLPTWSKGSSRLRRCTQSKFLLPRHWNAILMWCNQSFSREFLRRHVTEISAISVKLFRHVSSLQSLRPDLINACSRNASNETLVLASTQVSSWTKWPWHRECLWPIRQWDAFTCSRNTFKNTLHQIKEAAFYSDNFTIYCSWNGIQIWSKLDSCEKLPWLIKIFVEFTLWHYWLE